MAYLSGSAVYVATVLGLLSWGLAILAAAIFWKLDANAEQSMARFHLDVDRSRWEFTAWILGAVFVAVGGVFFLAAATADLAGIASVDTDMMRNVGRVGFITAVLLSMGTVGSWWRRF